MQAESKIRFKESPRNFMLDEGAGEPESVLFPGISRELREALVGVLQESDALVVGQHLIRQGDDFRDLYAVYSGSFKSYTDDQEGREHVLGFFLPGDLIGFDAIYTSNYRANFTALEPSIVAVLPYEDMGRLSQHFPELMGTVMRMMSHNIARNELLSGDYTAQERIAAFLIMMQGRLDPHRRNEGRFDLAMPRRDVANYLRLAPETVSRALTRLSREGLIAISGKEITLLQPEQLLLMAGPMGEL